MEAGSDTTSSTLLSFILAMIANPQVLQKAQQELDHVCGASKSPCSQDIHNLPYMRAIMTEVRTPRPITNSRPHFAPETNHAKSKTLRWRPVAPAGVPHLLIQDDWYDGYFLPKGTIVFANTWSIHQDPGQYESPEAFIPQRFLNDKFGRRTGKEASCNDTNDDHRRVTYAFGAGRRVCPGQRLAENSLVSMKIYLMAFVELLLPVDNNREINNTDMKF
jgi:cytochrome P450